MLTYSTSRIYKVITHSFLNGDAAALNTVVELSRDTVVLIATVSDLEEESCGKEVSIVIDFEATDHCFV